MQLGNVCVVVTAYALVYCDDLNFDDLSLRSDAWMHGKLNERRLRAKMICIYVGPASPYTSIVVMNDVLVVVHDHSIVPVSQLT